MYFALASDDLMLHVFASVTALTDYCEGIDVESGGWLFWDENGAALDPRFIEPVERSGNFAGGGTYVLEQAVEAERLAVTLHTAKALDSNPYFGSLNEVRKHIGGETSTPGR